MTTWIKTSERLPNLDTRVIVYGPGEGMLMTRLVEWGADLVFLPESDESPVIPVSNITHWMPLPEIPS